MIRHALLRAAAPCALPLLFLASPALLAADLLKLTPAQVRSAGIESAVVAPRQGGATQGLPAQVVIPAPQMRLVSAPLAGLVLSVTVATSQSVRRGQVLAQLASPGLADLQHTYLQASAQHQVAASALARDEKLLAEGIIAQSRLEAARGRRDEIAADLAERTQALKAAGMSAEAIARLRAGRGLGTGIDLVAPIDGVVLEQMAVPGQRLEAAAPVMKLAKLDPLWLEIQVPVDRMGGIEIGSEVKVPASDATARVIAIGRAVAGTTQTVAVRAEVRKGGERLRAGQLVEAVIGAGGAGGRAGWIVPAGAVARVGGRAQVYVQQADGFAVRAVQVLEDAGGIVVVSAPFTGNERVAVRGVATLKAIEAGIGGVQ
jgi:multidrug efflux pump subunit AcrA (membrane-fusion protein)